MSNTRKVKIQNILESQIPDFLNADSPLFKEFLNQYYISQTHLTGNVDLANNLIDYKNIATYASEKLYNVNHDCTLTQDLLTFDDEIIVNSTVGFPDRYGLIQIDDEIITYTGITTNSFTGCVRGFSGVSEIDDTEDSSGLTFSVTESEEHRTSSLVKNLSLIFYSKLFEKFKAQYLPDFQNRKFNSNVDLELILSRAKDFYLTKGTDISFNILFEILYADKISIIKPKDYIIRSSDDQYLVTKNILVEPLFGTFIPSTLIGNTIYQELSNSSTASASIYNVEYRTIDNLNLYEISLDSESFIYEFHPTKSTKILDKLNGKLIVDSTIGFEESGSLYIKIKSNNSYTIKELQYSGKTINEFLNITGIEQISYDLINVGDEIIENNLVKVDLDDNTTIQFRLINVISHFDFSNTNGSEVNDTIFLTSFGENFTDRVEFSSWIYNYPTYHTINPPDSFGIIRLKDSVRFTIGEAIELIYEDGTSVTSKVIDVLEEDRIQVSNVQGIPVKIKKTITKSSIGSTDCAYIQNTYLNNSNDSLVVAASGLPFLKSTDIRLNTYTFNLVGIGTIFATKNINDNTNIEHNLLSGNKIYLNSNNIGISTGQYYVKKIDNYKISLYQSTGDLYLSFSTSLNVRSSAINLDLGSLNSIVGIASRFEYYAANNNFSNQLLLKEFKVTDSLYRNIITSNSQIYTIEDVYNTNFT